MVEVKEFDFKTGKNTEDSVTLKETDGTKFVNKSEWKEIVDEVKSAKPSAAPVSGTKTYAHNIKTEQRTRVWNSDLEWFNNFDGYNYNFAESLKEDSLQKKESLMAYTNVMDIQEEAVASAYNAFITAKRRYFQEKKKLNKLYDVFELSELKDHNV